jgi:glycosyltransferase involved in cell wall biosynthesis
MKILYFTQLFYPAIFGGGEYIFYHWAKELIKKGHEVFVITQRLPKTPKNEVLDGINIFRVGSEPKLSGTLPIGIFSNASFLLGSFFMGMKIAKKYQIDVIHSNTYIPVFSAQWCAKRLHKPHIATVHDVYFTSSDDFWKTWAKQEHMSWLSKFLGPRIEKMIARKKITQFHTVSEKSKSDLLNLEVTRKISVIPNGINIDEYKQENITLKNQVIFVGRLIFYKNIGVIIDAINKVKKNIPDVKLVIIGDGPQKSELISKVNSQNLQSNVIFMGNVSDQEKIKQIHESKILLNPSLIEGFGIVVLEGFACGKPVLVSDSKPLSDLITESKDGFVLPSNDSDKWADKITELLSNPKLAEQMGQEGKQKVISQYSISQLTDNLIDLYHSVQT